MTSDTTHRVLVANRGEIAVRIIRAVHSLGWEAVAVYSDADADSLWVSLADDAVHLGASPAGKSYLDMDKVLDAARTSKCDLVHPGYGFLSERGSFARAVVDAGLTFVGAAADVIETMGDKAAARKTAAGAGVPVVPGSDVLTDPEATLKYADEVGYPVLVKASAGGGGRGIRFVQSADELASAVSTAQSEARSAFGDDAVYLEKAILDARHVEVQIIADQHGTVGHAFERDCSVQRRRQKLLEEAPAPDLSSSLREAMLEASVDLAKSVGYVGAGTLEYLVTGEEFYFIEMNTRIQVEHPISEQITGLDLVAEQLRVATGEPLSFDPQQVEATGVCFEFRINAEDSTNDFFPSPGTLERFDVPGGPGVRVETGYVAGGTVSPYYDSLLMKVVVQGRDRAEAIARSIQALSELRIEGVANTRDLHLRLLQDSAVADGPVTTAWLETYLART
ncbi:MAG: biotin carboxylase N-terminal domain-containing protein [Allobranchiibius sp.]